MVALVSGAVVLGGGVGEVEGGVEFEVDELEEDGIEIEEGDHNSIVDIDGQIGRILERHDIGNLLPQYLALVVNALDAHEHLPQSMRSDHKQLEVLQQQRARLHLLPR